MTIEHTGQSLAKDGDFCQNHRIYTVNKFQEFHHARTFNGDTVTPGLEYLEVTYPGLREPAKANFIDDDHVDAFIDPLGGQPTRLTRM